MYWHKAIFRWGHLELMLLSAFLYCLLVLMCTSWGSHLGIESQGFRFCMYSTLLCDTKPFHTVVVRIFSSIVWNFSFHILANTWYHQIKNYFASRMPKKCYFTVFLICIPLFLMRLCIFSHVYGSYFMRSLLSIFLCVYFSFLFVEIFYIFWILIFSVIWFAIFLFMDCLSLTL